MRLRAVRPSPGRPATQVDDSSPVAFLFPGHGARGSDHRELVRRHAPELLTVAQEITCADLFARELECQRFAQPAIYCGSIAAWRALRDDRSTSALLRAPYVFAGHSMGEISALVAAGSLSAEAGLLLVAERGRLMDEAAVGPAAGRMLAIVGARARSFVAEQDVAGAYLASDNAPEQVVISGALAPVMELELRARAQKLRTVRLPAKAAGHCPLMQSVKLGLQQVLRTMQFATPTCQVWSGISAAPLTEPCRELADAVVRPVVWRELTEKLYASGTRRFVDIGPGQMLSGFVARTEPAATTSAVQFQNS